MKRAAFKLENYTFKKVNIDLDLRNAEEVEINFVPSGKFKKTESTSLFELSFAFFAKSKKTDFPFIEIQCIATFEFAENISYSDIPEFFYANCIAIIFPYVRAYISTVTLQANITPILLPTMNLSSLAKPLRENTREE